MSRCTIIVQKTDGKVAEIYCYSGGTVEENGVLLLDYYNNQELAEELVKHGDLAILSKNCSKPIGHSFDSPIEGYCVYYSRDRGDDGRKPFLYYTIDEIISSFSGEEFIWMGGKWWWPDKNRKNEPLIPLTQALGIN